MKKCCGVLPVIFVIVAICTGLYLASGDGYPLSSAERREAGIQRDSRGPLGVGRSMDTSNFYERLAPYGSWINLDSYGYVWAPLANGLPLAAL
jgi:hypothetical protein